MIKIAAMLCLFLGSGFHTCHLVTPCPEFRDFSETTRQRKDQKTMCSELLNMELILMKTMIAVNNIIFPQATSNATLLRSGR
jgi:hypothetical protein